MCEIGILDPRKYETSKITEFAMSIYRYQGDSLGLVFIRETSDREKFQYDIFKATDPKRSEVKDFLSQCQDDAFRLIIHGRLATHGETTMENAHPIEVDCPECDVDHVLHNGVVYQHRQLRKGHENEGHEYQTDVDSEVIAHEYEEVPPNFDHETTLSEFSREPAFILLNETKAFIRTSGSYTLSEDGRMCRGRSFGPDRDEDYVEVILTPKNHD